MAWLLLTFLVTLGAALGSVGGVPVRELDPGIQAGVDGELPVWQGSCQETAKLTPPALA